jgi:hypothetical protein
MTYNLQAALLAAAAAFALTSSAASQEVRSQEVRSQEVRPQEVRPQEVRCNGGRTAGGECVNTELMTYARQSSVIFSQPKISQTAFPVLPSADVNFRYPHQLIPDQLRITPTGTPGGG